MENNKIANLMLWLVHNLVYSAAYYDLDLVSELAERLYRFETLGAYCLSDHFWPEETLERALEDLEIDMRTMMMENTEGERHYFAKDVFRNWNLIAEKAEEIFWDGASM